MLENLRKFNLDHCDLPTMLWNVAVGLRILTLNIDSRYEKGIPTYCYLLTIGAGVCYLYVFLISMVWFVSVRCPQTGDLVAAMVILSLGISSEIGNLKLIYMLVYADKIRKLTEQFLECDMQTIPGSRFQANLLKNLRVVKRRAILYWVVINGNGVLYILMPIITPGRNLPENYLVIYGLEPMFEKPNFEIAFIMIAVAVIYTCYVPASVTAYLIVIAGYTESQILALSEEMPNIYPEAVKKAEEEANKHQNEIKYEGIINNHIAKRLKEIMNHHATVKNLFRKVEDEFKISIAMGFLLLILGLIAELLGKLENTYLQTPFALMQVVMDCFIGQRVMDAGVIFEQAIYDCKWENFDKTNMKMIQVMVQNSQKTMILSAGGIATLSFSSLMTILRGVYSTYTTLRSTVKYYFKVTLVNSTVVYNATCNYYVWENTSTSSCMPILGHLPDNLINRSKTFSSCKYSIVQTHRTFLGTLEKMWEQLRKFSLDHCDLPTMLWNVAVGLRVLTVNIDSKYVKGIPIYYYLITGVLAASYFYGYIFSMIWFMIDRPTEDLVATVIILSLGISSEVGIVKMYMVINIDKIKKIVDDCLLCDAQTVLGGRFRANLLKSLRIVKKRALIYWIVIMSNAILYILRPMVLPGRNLPENRIVLYGLEPTFETPNYELTYFFTSAGVIFACYIPSCVTAFLIVTVGYIESQMLALSEEILQIWPDSVEKTNIQGVNVKCKAFRIMINEIVEKRLKQTIARHALLINLFRRVENVIKDATAMGFFFLVVGLLTELLGKLENTYLQMPYILIQVAIDCYSGQRMMDASILFKEAVYACQWENFDARNRKLVFVMLQVAQNPLVLKAGGVAALNFSCMMSIFKGTYSAYTALRLRLNL